MAGEKRTLWIRTVQRRGPYAHLAISTTADQTLAIVRGGNSCDTLEKKLKGHETISV
jgi:hypothetical protein